MGVRGIVRGPVYEIPPRAPRICASCPFREPMTWPERKTVAAIPPHEALCFEPVRRCEEHNGTRFMCTSYHYRCRGHFEACQRVKRLRERRRHLRAVRSEPR